MAGNYQEPKPQLPMVDVAHETGPYAGPAALEAAETWATTPAWVPPGDPLVIDWFHRQGPALNGSTERVGHFMVCYCRDRTTGQVLVTIDTLARVTGRSRSTVIRAIQEMQDTGHISDVEPIPAANGLAQNLYTFAGVNTSWEPTIPNVKLDIAQVRQLQREHAELQRAREQDREEIESLRRQLAEARGEPYTGPENLTPNSSSNGDESPITTITVPRVSDFLTPVEPGLGDQEDKEIVQALEAHWEQMGKTWRDGFAAAAEWFTHLGRCGSRSCKACPRYREATNPHREEFWRQLKWAEARLLAEGSATPAPGAGAATRRRTSTSPASAGPAPLLGKP